MNLVLLADLVLALHILWVLTILVPIPLLIIGRYRHWSWVRHRPFRIIHISMMGFVFAETLLGLSCPLTVWENTLRQASGEALRQGSFIGNLMRRLLYYELSPIVFILAYAGCFLLIAGLWIWVPPYSRRKDSQSSG